MQVKSSRACVGKKSALVLNAMNTRAKAEGKLFRNTSSPMIEMLAPVKNFEKNINQFIEEFSFMEKPTDIYYQRQTDRGGKGSKRQDVIFKSSAKVVKVELRGLRPQGIPIIVNPFLDIWCEGDASQGEHDAVYNEDQIRVNAEH